MASVIPLLSMLQLQIELTKQRGNLLAEVNAALGKQIFTLWGGATVSFKESVCFICLA